MSYIGNTATTQAFTPAIDYFNGDGSTVAFTLSRPVASVAQVQAVIANVPQNPGSAFTVSNNTITFTSAPPSGTSNIYVYYTSPITQVIAPGQGTVTPTALSQGGPSWDTSGNATLTGNITLNNGTADGAQLTLASSGYSDWNWDNYNGSLRAYNGATERLRLNTSGTVILQGGSTSATGVGITFPASQSASTDANTLDDYEEGTFTPAIAAGGLTPTVGGCRYTKIGNVVTATFDVTWPATADANFAGVTLPFAGISGVYANAFIGYTNYGSVFTIENQVGTSSFYFSSMSGGGLTNANFSGKRVIGTAVYITS